MDIPGIHSEGVVKLDNLADARHIMRLARRARSAVVVGGGITALELVEGLICHKVKVHYLLRGDRYWSNVLDEAESRIVEHRLKEDGVQIHYNSELGEILVKSDRVVGVQTRFTKTGERERGENQEGENIKCDILAVAIGVRPRLGLAKAAGIQIERGILVNEYLETNLPNIYAAGDVAQVYDPFSGKSVLDSLWSPARDMGTVAGFNMALSTTLDRSGQKTSYLKGVSINVTRLAHLTTTIIGGVGHGRDADMVGIARGDSEAWRHMPDAITVQDNQQVNRLRLLVGEQYLLGAIVMGDQSISLPLQQMIAQKVNILPIREQLFQSDAPLAQIILDYWKNNKPSAVKNTV